MDFRVVIWNLKGLDSNNDRGRVTLAEQAFRALADCETAIFSLVELGSELLLAHLADTLGGEWAFLYGSSSEARGGIGLLFRGDRISATLLDPVTEPHYQGGKPIKIGRECAAVYQIKCVTGREFLFAVVHFKAEEGASEFYTRTSQAIWLRRELETFADETTLPVVIVGDFNGEPCEEMFGESGFRAFRRADAAMRSRDTLKLYNPMWRLLADPQTALERSGNNGNTSTRPCGTYLNTIWHSLIDGVIVSSEWLAHGNYVLHDERLEILTNELWHHIGTGGAHHAFPASVRLEQAITDHLPIAINLEVT